MAKVKMTKEQVLRLHAGSSKSKLTGHKFTYAVTRNRESLDPVVKAIQAALEPIEGYNEYEDAIQKVNVKFANKDAKGNPVKFNLGNDRFLYDIPGLNIPTSDYSGEIDKVKEKFKTTLEKQEKKNKEDEKFLQENVSIDLLKIPLNAVPENIPQEVMDGLFFMIKEPTESEME